MDFIKSRIESGIYRITLNRPEVYNSFNRTMALEMQDALDEAAEDDAVRCLIITGEGKAFCAGQDLKEAIDEEGPGLRKIVEEHFNPIIRKIRGIEKPVIAAVNGAAAGAGANIVLACDLAVAKESAYFLQAFSKIGLIPDSGGTFFLPRLVGLQRATALTMLAEKLPAKEAEKIGLIYKAVSDDVFEAEVNALAEQLASMPTRGLGLTKKAFNASLSNDLETQLDVEEQLQYTASQTHDYQEGVQAFLEKRKPKFRGN